MKRKKRTGKHSWTIRVTKFNAPGRAAIFDKPVRVIFTRYGDHWQATCPELGLTAGSYIRQLALHNLHRYVFAAYDQRHKRPSRVTPRAFAHAAYVLKKREDTGDLRLPVKERRTAP